MRVEPAREQSAIDDGAFAPSLLTSMASLFRDPLPAGLVDS